MVRGLIVARKVSATQAKAQLPALMAEVAYGGGHITIERRGKPLAALISVEELKRLEQGQATSTRPQGALTLVGSWREVEDGDLEALIADIYARREEELGRPVEFEP
jgi:prevent-host-death family protein